MRSFAHLAKEETGSTALEYAIITFLVSLAIMAATQGIGLSTSNIFAAFATVINHVTSIIQQ